MRSWFVLILLSLSSCIASKNSDVFKTATANKIFMGVFKVTRSTADSTTISVAIEKHFWADGEIPEVLPTLSSTSANQLTFIFLDEKSRILKTFTASNPLRQDFEFYAEGGKLEKKTVNLMSAPLMIRTQMTTNLNTIKIVNHEKKLLSLLTVTP